MRLPCDIGGSNPIPQGPEGPAGLRILFYLPSGSEAIINLHPRTANLRHHTANADLHHHTANAGSRLMLSRHRLLFIPPRKLVFGNRYEDGIIGVFHIRINRLHLISNMEGV